MNIFSNSLRCFTISRVVNKLVMSMLLFTALVVFSLQKVNAAELTEYDACILKSISTAGDDMQVGEVSRACAELKLSEEQHDASSNNHSIIDNRLKIEKSNQFKSFTLMAFKPNFIIPLSYNGSGYDSSLYPASPEQGDVAFDKYEAQFQISIKTPLVVDLFKKDITLYAGYTNRSFWQVYNSNISRPFRETNHEPEIWLQSTGRTGFMGFNNRINMLGFSHQSNGRGGDLSRS